jgi:hypothetical protein
LPARRDPPRSAAFSALSTRERALCLIDLSDEIEAILAAAGRLPAGVPAPPRISLGAILFAYASVQRRQSYSLKRADGAEPPSWS